MVEITPIVYVVDENLLVRETLESMIRNLSWRPRIFASVEEFLSHPRASAPCCMVLDVSPPGLKGFDLQQRLAGELSGMPVILITDYGDVPTTVRAMKAGAVEFMTKPLDGSAIIDAICSAIQRSIMMRVHMAELQALQARHASLSRRECEVMALVVSGLMNKQVGGQLGISEITVKAHRGRAMHKMEATSLADLVNIASKLRIPDVHVHS
jgi:FixJ family two-component response regulator